MSKIVAVTNMKGGTGKTTCCTGLAGAFAEAGHRVLVVDLDGQGNLTSFFRTRVQHPTIYDVLVEQIPITQAIRATGIANIDIAAADPRLHQIGQALGNRPDHAVHLDSALQERQRQRHPYDIVLLDCPPNLGPTTVNALVAADAALIPIKPAQFSVDGLWQVAEFIGEARKLNPRLVIDGVLINLHHRRRTIERTYIDTLQNSAGVHVLDVHITDSVHFEHAVAAGKPITHYLPRSEQADLFRRLARIVLPSVSPQPVAHAHANH